MSFWQFLATASKRALHHAWEAAHHTYFFLFLAGSVVLLAAGWQLDKMIVYAIPLIALVVVAFIGVWRQMYALFRDERTRADSLAGELDSASKSVEPRLEIMNDNEDDWLFGGKDRCQVQVKNRTDAALKYRGQLTDITPRPDVPAFQLPVHLQIAGEREGTSEGVVLGGQGGLIEVFTFRSDPDGNKVLCIYGATNPIVVDRIPYRVVITVQADQGKSVSKSFMLSGQNRDSLVLHALPNREERPTALVNESPRAIPTERPPRRSGRRLCLLALMLFNRLWRTFFDRRRRR